MSEKINYQIYAKENSVCLFVCLNKVMSCKLSSRDFCSTNAYACGQTKRIFTLAVMVVSVGILSVKLLDTYSNNLSR